MAVSHGHLAVVKLFYQEHRAELPLEDLDAKGHSLLHSAACGEGTIAHIPVMKFSLSKGLDVNATSTQGDGYTPLSMAIRATTSSAEAVQLLLDHGADPMQKVGDGLSILIDAMCVKNTAVLEMLIDHST
jgi:ankyrin repeat protein